MAATHSQMPGATGVTSPDVGATVGAPAAQMPARGAPGASPVPALDYELQPGVVSRRRYRRVLWLAGLTWLVIGVLVVGAMFWRARSVARAQERARAAQAANMAAVKAARAAAAAPGSGTVTVTQTPVTVTDWMAEQRRRQAWVAEMMRRSRPASQVVYEEDPAGARQLLDSRRGYHAADSERSSGVSRPQGYQPPVYVPALDVHMAASPTPPDNANAEVFHGALTSPAGNRRLVRLELRVRFGAQTRPTPPGEPKPERVISLRRQLAFTIWRPDEASGHFSAVRYGDSLKLVQPDGQDIPIRWVDGVLRAARPREHDLRFYAGQLDPADPAHFTIDYELNGVRDTIDGWLTDDDFLRIRPRGGTVTGGDWHVASKP